MATQNLLELPPRNAAGRLIVYGFAHGIYIGFPGERQFEWEYALSGLQALDPENF